MAYAVRRSARARNDIRDFFRYLRKEAGETIALKYRDALENDILRVIANNPYVFSWFHETGAPYRAKLFKLASPFRGHLVLICIFGLVLLGLSRWSGAVIVSSQRVRTSRFLAAKLLV